MYRVTLYEIADLRKFCGYPNRRCSERLRLRCSELAPCVTPPASAAAFPPAMQLPRRTPRSLSLGSFRRYSMNPKALVLAIALLLFLCVLVRRHDSCSAVSFADNHRCSRWCDFLPLPPLVVVPTSRRRALIDRCVVVGRPRLPDAVGIYFEFRRRPSTKSLGLRWHFSLCAIGVLHSLSRTPVRSQETGESNTNLNA